MIQPLVIKNKTFVHNLVQGPLAGVSCAPFRALTSQWGQPAFTYTEMISSKTLINGSKALQRRFVLRDPIEPTVCFQLSANNATELGLATKIVTDYGADLVDLNCGCPVRKIRSKGSGSHLLSKPQEIYSFIRTMQNNTHCPVSVKIRVDANSDDHFNQDVANAIADAGPDFVTVHGRHWTQGYDVACAYDDIQFFVQALPMPVIGNGDIKCVQSLRVMLATGCAGVMIARAGVGQPWLIQKLLAQMKNENFQIPDNSTIGQLFIQHISGLCELLGQEKFAILQARTFAKYYARELSNKEAFCLAFNQCIDLKCAITTIERYFNGSHSNDEF